MIVKQNTLTQVSTKKKTNTLNITLSNNATTFKIKNLDTHFKIKMVNRGFLS